jgi:hypothetical protein
MSDLGRRRVAGRERPTRKDFQLRGGGEAERGDGEEREKRGGDDLMFAFHISFRARRFPMSLSQIVERIFGIMAQWDLTKFERAIMNASLRGGN